VDTAAAAIEVNSHSQQTYKRALDAYLKAAWTKSQATGTAIRCSWLHSKENPSPAITAMLCPPKESRSVAVLTDPAGRLITDPKAKAALMVAFWGKFSAGEGAEGGGDGGGGEEQGRG
jgi:hypothetical protein